MRYFWTTAELRAAGASGRDIALKVDAGELVPLRRGLFAVPGAPLHLVRAARVGGAATATTALAASGLFEPPDARTHVAARAGTHLHNPDLPIGDLVADESVCVHWTDRLPPVRTLPDRVAPLLLVLEHVVRCLRPELAVAVLDSALHRRVLKPSQLAVLAADLPRHLHGVVAAVDGGSDSGVESIARVLLRAAGLTVVVHPVIDGIGEVDMLVAGLLIVEVDGREFHTGADVFANDRRRDREAARRGYRTLRFTYRQVMDEWPQCLEAVLAVLAQAA